MTRHDPLVRIRHMRDHAREAIEMLGDKALDELLSNRMLQLALIQLIAIVGEAATQVNEETREDYPAVPWQLAADMRNKIIHGYDAIEHAIVYDTVKYDLPPLVARLDEILGDE